MKEIWKKIDGYEKYYVSNLGNIKNIKRNSILKQGVCGNYHNIQLCKNGLAKTFLVHRLVAKAFLKDYKEELIVNHKDLNGLNNVVENLEICTQKQNIAHAIKNNAFTFGVKNGMSKLTSKEVVYIKKSLENPYHGINKDLAKKFNVKQSTISEIRRGKTWVDV